MIVPAAWFGSRAERFGWGPTGIIPRRRQPSCCRWRLLDRPDAGNKSAIQPVRTATGHVTAAESRPTKGISRRPAAHALCRLPRVHAAAVDVRSVRPEPVVVLSGGRGLAPSVWSRTISMGSIITLSYTSRIPTHRLRRMGGQGAADRSGMGICRARRTGRRGIRLGRRIHARRPLHGQHLAGRISTAQS